MSKFAWKPWDVYKRSADIPKIKEPPCPHCRFWRPQVQYIHTSAGYLWDGIRCCHAEDQHHDFSCFKPLKGAI